MRITAAALLAVLCAVFSAGSASSASTLSCGEDITSGGTYVLASDLSCGPDPIRVDAGLDTTTTIDLGGHTLSGGGIFLAIYGQVTIEDGTIANASNGVWAGEGAVQLNSVQLRDNSTGIQMPYGRGTVTILDSSITHNSGDGVELGAFVDFDIERDVFASNGGNGVTGLCDGAGTFRNDVFVKNGRSGVLLNGCEATIENDAFVANGGDGLNISDTSLFIAGDVLEDNVAIGNNGHGIIANLPVTDRGGNLAGGNRTSPQCVNVACGPLPSDTTPAQCVPIAMTEGQPKQLVVAVQDSQSGIVAISHSETNATVNFSFTPGTASSVAVTATKIVQTVGSHVTLTVTDRAGNTTTCDPRWRAAKHSATVAPKRGARG